MHDRAPCVGGGWGGEGADDDEDDDKSDHRRCYRPHNNSHHSRPLADRSVGRQLLAQKVSRLLYISMFQSTLSAGTAPVVVVVVTTVVVAWPWGSNVTGHR